MPGSLHLVKPPAPPKPKGVPVQIQIPLGEDERLVRIVGRIVGETKLTGFWRLERFERPQGHGPWSGRWREVEEPLQLKPGELPRSLKRLPRVFLDQLRQAADELEAANVVETPGSSSGGPAAGGS
jgi:hypothetical protein